MSEDTHRLRVWTRDECQRMLECGIFGPEERLELLRGKIYRKVQQTPAHATGILLTAQALEETFPTNHIICQQYPVALAEHSEPEPDVVVLPGRIEEYPFFPPPERVKLLVEVADTTLYFDQEFKAALYAEAGIAEYWILNLNERQLEVLRQPAADQTARYDYAYQSRQILSETDTISPLAASSAPILVSDMLPV
jgi:Uma2 family endonuclease